MSAEEIGQLKAKVLKYQQIAQYLQDARHSYPKVDDLLVLARWERDWYEAKLDELRQREGDTTEGRD